MTIRDIAIAFGYEVDKESEKKAENSIQGLKSMATKLLGALGIGFSLTKLNAIAEEFNGINDRLKFATKEMGDQNEIQQQVLATANNIRSTYADTVDAVSNLVQQNSTLFDTTEKALTFVELTNKAWKAAGRSEAEIASLNQTLGNSFALGAVNASEFQALMKRSPETIAYMEKALGKTRDELLVLAKAGKLSADTLYTAFTGSADDINFAFEELGYSISDAMKHIRNGWGLFIDGLNTSLGITDTIGRTMVRAFNMVLDVLKRMQSWLEKVAKAVGGTERLFKLVAIAAGAIFLALNTKKIVSFLQGVGKLLGGINLKLLATIAVIVMIALIVEDFINFMKGNDSVIGSMLEQAGIDTEQVRDTIISAWQAIKNFLGSVWEAIRSLATAIWGKLKDFWTENGEAIKESLLEIWESISSILSTLWETIWNIATTVFNALRKFWDAWGDNILKVFSALWDGIVKNFMFVVDIIKNIFKAFAALLSGDWNGLWEAVKNIVASVMGIIVNTIATWLNALWALFGDILTNIWNKVVEAFSNIKDSITDKVTSIKETIVDGFQAAIDWITSLPEQALQWGKDIIQGIVDGIKGAVGGVTDAVKGVGNKIKSFLGFSVPDEGPLSEFESWMPDFMQGLAQGIQNSKSAVTDAVKSLADEMTVSPENYDAIAESMSALVNRAKEVGDKIKSALSFSISDEDPLSGYESRGSDLIQSLAQGIQNSKSAVTDAVKSLANEMNVSPENYDAIAESMSALVNRAKETGDKIKSTLSFSIPDEDPLSNYESRGSDLMQSLAQSIQKGKSLVLDAVQNLTSDISVSVDGLDRIKALADIMLTLVNRAKEAGNNIRSSLSYAIPDEGSRSGYSNESPDILQGLIQGFQKGKSLITEAAKALTGEITVSLDGIDAIRSLVGNMSLLVHGASPQTSTTKTLAVGASNRSVTQNVNIENTFNGDKAIQKNTANAMDTAASDATGQMARGLAYVR